ncbi:MAG: prepilin peptidase [Desulfobulbus propionicus]|nr:MAG: prepilin peptidase [Desulfobulbus propionicus]
MDNIFFSFALLLGAVVGSFLNVVILRLPDPQQSIAFPSSHCTRCQTPIHWFDNIPVVSWLILRGKCRSCQEAISIQYPIVEICMALLSAGLITLFGPGFDFFYYFIFCAALLVIIVIDIHHQIIPDLLSLPGIIIGFAGSFVATPLTWIESGMGVLLGGAMLYAVALGYYLLTRREGMGGGDIKLLAMIGAFLGWQSLLFVIFTSSLLGTVVGVIVMIIQGKGGKTRIPFGPFLSVAALFFLFFREQIFTLWYTYLSMGGV